MAKVQKHADALTALLESNTLSEAAEKAGISRKTLYNYLRNDKPFARAYEDMQNQRILEQLDILNDGLEEAQRVIMSIMRDDKQLAAVRLQAAKSLYAIADIHERKAKGITQENIDRNPQAEWLLDSL